MSQSALIVLAEFDDAQQAALVAFDHIGVLGEHGEAALPQTRRGRAFADMPVGVPASWNNRGRPRRLDPGAGRSRGRLLRRARSLWASVLTRKGGSYALVARMPADPSMN